ncbi:efflux RND transporter permease subunit [Bacillus sp. Marseille-P3661]|uniref:efflux RND transporter permease subunit n=1 Tax=Bacillus sp. Marseille-P3661 TaxID=1936234 RepID=UPI000C814B32|nr:efflux RND transporter permease subunit [Bacillus sp. Marseille-P3661]
MKLSGVSIKRPILTLVSMILIIILGIVSVINIPLKLMPDINPPIGAVVSSYPGANPQEVLEKVTKPIENQLATLPGLKAMSSTSQEGSSLTLLEFSWSVTLDDVESDILSRINQVDLPDDASNPSLLKFDPAQMPIIQLSLAGGKDHQDFQEKVKSLEQKLGQVDGVANIDTTGLVLEEINIELDQAALHKYGLTQSDIVDIIRANHISLPGEPIKSADKQLTTRVLSILTSIDELKNIFVTVDHATGEKVTLADVGVVELIEEENKAYTRVNQEPAVMLSILQQSDANTVSVSNGFQERLNELLDDAEYEMIEATIINDQGDYVKLAINSMRDALVLGGFLAMLILFIFLRNVRSPLIVGISIPFSVIFTFVLMYFADFSLNIMTLGGLALGIGMLVDNSIVVIENISRHLEMGKDKKQAAFDGAVEVGGAITASTLTTVAVFVPIVFTSGIIGNLFKEFSLTIAFSLFASLLVALTVVPMFASIFITSPKLQKGRERSHVKKNSGLERGVRWALHHRAMVIIITVLLLGIGLFGVATVGTQFLPVTDEGYFTIDITLPEGVTLEDTDKLIQEVETYFDGKNEVANYLAFVGTQQSVSFGGSSKANQAQVLVKMVEESQRDLTTAEFVDEIERDVRQLLADAEEITFNQQSSTGSQPNTLTFTVRDSNKERLEQSVTDISKAIGNLEALSEVKSSLTETDEEVQINVNSEKAFEHGLMPAQVATLVNQVTRGMDAAVITTENNQVYTVNVEYDQEFIKNTEQLRKLLIRKGDGTFIPLETVVSFSRGEGPSTINRIDQEDAVEFTLKYRPDENLGDVTAKIREEIDDLNLPAETQLSFTGDTELMESAIDDLSMAILLAVIFVYLVMAGQFESLKYPIVIMVSVPLIVIGVSIALFVTNTPLGVTAIIGLLVLAGIVVNNAIVLVEYILQRKQSGSSAHDAIVESVKVRTRPILMTSLTTMLGLVPIALGIGEGTEMQQPMGITVIGGLFSSTFLTLLVIPVVYSFFDKETRKLNKVKKQTVTNNVDKTEQLKDLTKEELLELIHEIEKEKK